MSFLHEVPVRVQRELGRTVAQLPTDASTVSPKPAADSRLIFRLRRLDVWPVEDYGVRKGYLLAYGLRKLLTPKQLELKGERFRPYRTVAAWYCWRAVHEERRKRQ